MGFFDFIYPDGKSPEVTVAQARVARDSGSVIVDIRPIYQWNRGHIDGALHIPEERLATSEPVKQGASIILVCEDGNRSLHTASRLKAAGVDATNIHGGFTAWKSAGYPVAI